MIEALMRGDKPPNAFTENLGALVRQARQEHNWSQEQLAQAANLRRSTISDIENGKVDPAFSTLARIALVTNKSISSFIPIERLRAGISEANLDPFERELINAFQELKYSGSSYTIELVIAFIKLVTKLDYDYARREEEEPNLYEENEEEIKIRRAQFAALERASKAKTDTE